MNQTNNEVLAILGNLLSVEEDGAITIKGVVELENGRRVRVQFEVDLNDKERKAVKEWLEGK